MTIRSGFTRIVCFTKADLEITSDSPQSSVLIEYHIEASNGTVKQVSSCY